MYPSQVNLDQLHLQRFNAYDEAKKRIRYFRVERHPRPGAPPVDLLLNLWQPDTPPGELPETLKGLEIYSYPSGDGVNVKCGVVLHDRRVIDALTRIEDDILEKLSLQTETAAHLHRAYDAMEWGHLLQPRLIRGREHRVLNMTVDMSKIDRVRRIAHGDGGYRIQTDSEATTIAELAWGQRIFPCVRIKSVECYAQTIKFNVEAHRIDMFHEAQLRDAASDPGFAENQVQEVEERAAEVMANRVRRCAA